MQRLTQIAEMYEYSQRCKQRQARIAFVPTMGNLHAGHVALMQAARQYADHIVVSLFVNPSQFAPHEDFSAYPRTLEKDCAECLQAGVDVIFHPEASEIYATQQIDTSFCIDTGAIGAQLCGRTRPHFFSGVATVICKLLNIVCPDHCFFGEKDYQQLLIVRALVAQLHFPVKVHAVPTVRASDGLALSSRNQYLSAEQRIKAATLYHVLQETAQALKTGDLPHQTLEQHAIASLTTAGFAVDYLTICHAETLQAAHPWDKMLVVLAAAWLGKARLIDNIIVQR